jgi:hypothetical protein
LPATTILAILESAVVEINRLQRELDQVNSQLKELSKKSEKQEK